MMSPEPEQHFRTAWRVFRSNPWVFIKAILLLFASWVTLEVTVVALHRFGVVFNVAIHLAFLVFYSGLMVGTYLLALNALDGGNPRFRLITSRLGRGPQFLLASGIYLAAVALGLLVFILPGVYIAVRYALFGPVLAAEGGSALEALRVAGRLSSGRWWTVGRFLLLGLALHLAGAALLGVGLLVTAPVSLIATASLYRSLQRAEQTPHMSAA